MVFPSGSDGKESVCNAGDLGSIQLFDPLPSILAWRVPWTEEPERLPSIGLQRVGHNLATKPPPLEISSPGGSDGKESARNAGDLALITNLGGSPGEENGNPLQFSCLESSMDRGASWATPHGVAKSQTRLSD